MIGIDIGGSKIRGVLWDGKRAIAVREFRTPRMRPAFEERVRDLVSELSNKAGLTGPVARLGIGVAGSIRGTTVTSSRNIKYFRNFDFKPLFPHIRIKVDNDARTFALAEILVGVARNARQVLVCTIGTGIGRAWGVDGRVRSLTKFEHAEKWERVYQLIRDRGDDGKLARLLGKKIAVMCRRLRPDTIVLGGGVVNRPGLLKKIIDEFHASGLETPILGNRLGVNAGAIGAALLARSRH